MVALLTLNKSRPSLPLLSALKTLCDENIIEVRFEKSNSFTNDEGKCFPFSTDYEIYKLALALYPGMKAETLDEKILLTSFIEVSTSIFSKTTANNEKIDKLAKFVSNINYKKSEVNFTLVKIYEVIIGTFNKKEIKSNAILSEFIKFIEQQKDIQQLKSFIGNLEKTEKVRIKDEAKFAELPDAKKSQVVVRFPPEASGYLHIGHIKAALVNHIYKKMYNGKLILRFDDTNPEKESPEFEKAIIEDLNTLGIEYDELKFTSDHFETLIDFCTKLITLGFAYADDTSAEDIKIERDNYKPSKNREMSTKSSLEIWHKMVQGNKESECYCIRAKIDYKNLNGKLRDPVIYRMNDKPHACTGTKFHVYPTYTFACPIIDSLDGVTHALRTTEYHDMDPVNHWFLQKLGLHPVHICDYGRLSLQYTVLSKRKLTWFIENRIVESWEDPRMPTIRGFMNRGLTKEALYAYIESQGASRNSSQMQDNKLWAFNRSHLEPIVTRYYAFPSEDKYEATISNFQAPVGHHICVALRPKSTETRNIPVSEDLMIGISKSETVQVGQVINLINWMNFKILEIDHSSKKIVLEQEPEDKEYKTKLKCNFVSKSSHCKITCVYYGHLLTIPIVKKGDDFTKYINHDNVRTEDFIAEKAMSNIKAKEKVQILKHGLYVQDSRSSKSDANKNVTFIKIPEN